MSVQFFKMYFWFNRYRLKLTFKYASVNQTQYQDWNLVEIIISVIKQDHLKSIRSVEH